MKRSAFSAGLGILLLMVAATLSAAEAQKEKEIQLEKVRPSAADAPAEPGKKRPRSMEQPATKATPGTIKKAPTQPARPPKLAPRKAAPRAPAPKGPGDPIHVEAPTANQLVRLGSGVDVRWRRNVETAGAPECGTQANLYAVRMDTNESFPIAQNRDNALGPHSYRWNVSTSFFFDIRGSYRVDVVSASAPSEPSCRAQSAVFRIVSSDEMAESSGESDYDIEYVQFADGRALDEGIAFDADGIETTIEVGVRWNREGATPDGASSTVEVRSDVTGEVVGLRMNPDHFNHGNADSSGLIRVSAPIRIDADDVLAMKRDRFIPLRLQLGFSDGSVDAFAHNNRETARLRVLDMPTVHDLELVDLTGFSMELSMRARRLNYNRHEFTLTVQARTLSRNEAGGALPDLDGVRATWTTGSDPPSSDFAGAGGTVHHGFALSAVPGSGAISTTTFEGILHHPPNWWTPSWIVVRIHPPEGVLDPDLTNNTKRFELPYLE